MNWPETFDARAVSPWQNTPVQPIPRPDFADNEQLKQAFGIALGRGLDSFNAGLETFNGDTPKGLWASLHWVNDPIVIASKDAYLKTLKKAQKPLDKEELLQEVLERAKSCIEDKDAVAFFKLYSEIAGFTGKALVDQSVNYTTNNSNLMKITLVGGSGDKAPDKVIDQDTKSKMQNDVASLPKLKLVGGANR